MKPNKGYWGVTDPNNKRHLVVFDGAKYQDITTHDWGGEPAEGMAAIRDMIAHRTKNENIAHNLAARFYNVWIVDQDITSGTWFLSFDRLDSAMRIMAWDIMDEIAELDSSKLAEVTA